MARLTPVRGNPLPPSLAESIGVAVGVNDFHDAGILDIVIAGRVPEVCGAKQFHQLRVAKLKNEFVRSIPANYVENE